MSAEAYPRIFLYRRLVQAKLFIDAYYTEAIDLNNIADEACFSKYHFIRQFKSIYRKTPHQYLIHVRIKRAKKLLDAGTPVTETCYAVGFESLSSFSGLFKKVYDISPSAYARQQQERKIQISESPLSFIPACFAGKNGWI
ncbi:MAG TPA: AraC family transcriptional regulator [Mucilaginibacter sp.]